MELLLAVYVSPLQGEVMGHLEVMGHCASCHPFGTFRSFGCMRISLYEIEVRFTTASSGN